MLVDEAPGDSRRGRCSGKVEVNGRVVGGDALDVRVGQQTATAHPRITSFHEDRQRVCHALGRADEPDRQTEQVLERVRERWRQWVDATIRREHSSALADARHLTRRHPAEGVAWSAALAVHLMTAGLIALAVLVGVSQAATLVKVIAIVLLVAVAAVLVRLGKPHRPPGWTRSQAPALFAVVDQIAAAVGAPPPARILATHELNTRVMGHRPRAVLAIGLPGWAAMPPAGRVALVAHALAAGSDGGVGRSPVVTAALASLQEWRYLLQPNPQAARRRPRRRRAGGRSASNLGIADLVLPVVLAPIYLLTVTL